MSVSLTLADYQATASELVLILPSDVPLTAELEPAPSYDFSLPAEQHEITVRRVGAQEINLLLVVSDVLIAPLAQAGLGFDAKSALRSAVEQVAGSLGEAITTEISPDVEQFKSGSAVVFVLKAGAETRGWFVIQVREVNAMSNDSAFTPSAEAEGVLEALNATDNATAPVASASERVSVSASTAPHAATAASAPATPAQAAASAASVGNMRLLYDVEMTLTAEIGRAKLPVRQILDLTPGAIVELDRVAGSPADLMVNGHLVARGEVVVIDEDYGLRITEILDTSEAFV